MPSHTRCRPLYIIITKRFFNTKIRDIGLQIVSCWKRVRRGTAHALIAHGPSGAVFQSAKKNRSNPNLWNGVIKCTASDCCVADLQRSELRLHDRNPGNSEFKRTASDCCVADLQRCKADLQRCKPRLLRRNPRWSEFKRTASDCCVADLQRCKADLQRCKPRLLRPNPGVASFNYRGARVSENGARRTSARCSVWPCGKQRGDVRDASILFTAYKRSRTPRARPPSYKSTLRSRRLRGPSL